jgi:hypothetical protein
MTVLAIKRLFVCLAAAAMFGFSAGVMAKNVLIINGTSTTSETDTTASITTNLWAVQVAAGNTVTINDQPPASLVGFDEVWDIRFDNSTALTGPQQALYLAFLQAGHSMFIMGENDAFTTRNDSVIAFVASAGGGSPTFLMPGDSQTVFPPFNAPNAVTTIQYLAAGGTTTPGTGAFATANASGGTAISWKPPQLANAAVGKLVVAFDVNFMQTDAYAESQAFLRNLVGASQDIFVGVFGGGLGELIDDAGRSITSYVDGDIEPYVQMNQPQCASTECDPALRGDLEAIAATNTGGITSIGFWFADLAATRTSLNTPGNSEVLKNDVSAHYADGGKVYLVGFSVGGGDIQNLLEKLDVLGIPVRLSGHIDSIETIGNDATIPKNTARAMGFFQKQSKFIVWGENGLKASDRKVTVVTNTRIKDPAGPADPKTDPYAYHRNMDNDPRVWESLLDSIATDITQAAPARQLESSCATCSGPVNEVVVALGQEQPAERKRAIRKDLAMKQPAGQTLQDVLTSYYATTNEELRTHLADVISHMGTKGVEDLVYAEARKTIDYSVFVSLVYSLRNAGTELAKRRMLQLAADRPTTGSDWNTATAIYFALSDQIGSRDFQWMLDTALTSVLVDDQIHLMGRLLRPHLRNDGARQVIRALVQRGTDPKLNAILDGYLKEKLPQAEHDRHSGTATSGTVAR